MAETHEIPAGTGPDSLWRQAERAAAAAGERPFAERVAAALVHDLLADTGVYHEYGYDGAAAPLERRWAEIIDRHIREATGVR